MRVYLRPVTLDDGDCIIRWRNSPKVSRNCFTKKILTLDDNKSFFENYIITGKYKQFIVERIDEDYGIMSYPIATVYLKDLDETNKRCELCIFTSDDEEWNTESQSIAIKILLDKAFTDYGMRKVYSFVFSDNEEELTLMERCGFKREAILNKEAINGNGDYVDIIRMSIFAGDM